jgi:hypothetical protein
MRGSQLIKGGIVMKISTIVDLNKVVKQLQEGNVSEDRIINVLTKMAIWQANGNVNNIRYWVRWYSSEMHPLLLVAVNKFLG